MAENHPTQWQGIKTTDDVFNRQVLHPDKTHLTPCL